MTTLEIVRRDDGAVSAALVGVTFAVVIVALAVIAVGSTLATRSRVAGAADAAALASADVLLGVVAGEPCTRARSVAAANRVSLSACVVDVSTVTVEVVTRVGPLEVGGRATAGPAPTRGPLP